MFGTTTIDLGDPTTMFTFIGNLFTTVKTNIQPIMLWAIGLGVTFAALGIVYKMIRRAKRHV